MRQRHRVRQRDRDRERHGDIQTDREEGSIGETKSNHGLARR